MKKCYLKNCVNGSQWACMYRDDCDDCNRGCKHYYQCDSCDYYLDDIQYWKVTNGSFMAVVTCPYCNHWFDIEHSEKIEFNYCPNCGIKLEFEEKDFL